MSEAIGWQRYQLGCSFRFIGSKGLVKFMKALQSLNCLSSSMCNFENGRFHLSYSSITCLYCLECI